MQFNGHHTPSFVTSARWSLLVCGFFVCQQKLSQFHSFLLQEPANNYRKVFTDNVRNSRFTLPQSPLINASGVVTIIGRM